MPSRTVRFYEIVNANRERLPAQLPFDQLREAIRNLADTDAYVNLARMELLGSAHEVNHARRAEPLIVLDRITRDVRLRIERDRTYRPLGLDENETLAEPSFYTIFDQNVLGIMRNSGSSPGPASFRDYVNSIGVLTDDIEVVPLADPGALRALNDVDTLKRVDIAVGADVNADVFAAEAPAIAGAVRQVHQQLGNVAIELSIKLTPAPRGDGGGQDNPENAYTQVRGLALSDAMGYVDKLAIKYRSIEAARVRSFDFIDEAVATQTDVELQDAVGYPTEPSASVGMAEAYDEMLENIRSALQALNNG